MVLVQASISTGDPACYRMTTQYEWVQRLTSLFLAAPSQGQAQMLACMKGSLRCIGVADAGQSDNGDREAH